jgi:hypothetical protein
VRVKFALDSIAQITTTFAVVGREIKKAARAGVQTHLELVGEQSQREVPRDTGALARSMQIHTREHPQPYGWIDYTAPYAIPVHEIPSPPNKSVGGRSARHDPPTKWRYLADPFKREQSQLVGRVADACARELRRQKRAAGRKR